MTSAPARGRGRRSEAGRPPRRSGDWARRMPAFRRWSWSSWSQLPFLFTIIASFMNWNAYYPDERGFGGLANYRRC